MMRSVDSIVIKNIVKKLCLRANIDLRGDIYRALENVRRGEKNLKARRILGIIIDNAKIARKKRLPLCQDTGMVVVYIKIGQGVRVKGDIKKAVEKGIGEAYKEGYFRNSIVEEPLIRKSTHTNLPPIIYTDFVTGNKIDIRVVVKGFGCENASRIKMFRPTDSSSLIEDFIVDTVNDVGSKACPPYYIGIGIGGTLDKAVLLSKEAVLRPLGEHSKKPHIKKLESDILKRVNRLKIGPMGVGGNTTALGVSILTYPTHIAGLPVAVNISCHATRDARKII